MAEKVWFPTEQTFQNSRIYQWMKRLGYQDYDSFHKASIQDIKWFWGEAEKVLDIEWYQPYREVLDLSKGKKWPKWFTDGKINVVHNALDKWLKESSNANRLAIIWEREDGLVEKYTYKELAVWVDHVAAGLKKEGIEKGDRVGIYLPMIPETIVSVLAVAKIGAIFTPIFSGFGADPVAKRLESAQAKMLITTDGFIRRGKINAMKEEADKAVNAVSCIEKVVVIRHLGKDIPWNTEKDVDWTSVENSEGDVPTEWMDSMDPLMIAYTSGTTGRPKGAVHTHGGFPLRVAFEAGFNLDVHPEEVMFWVTDMGWIMGPLVLFGTLLNGATMLLYEGSPDYPKPNRIFEVVEKHSVSMLGISPTLIRSLMSHGDEAFLHQDLSCLKSMASTGEPWNPEAWNWLFDNIGKRRIPIFNLSGGTEIGGGILSNTLLKPIAPTEFNAVLPGMDADVYNSMKQSVNGQSGELVLKQPWLGMTNGFWQEPDRYEETYFSVWEDTWVHGDAVIRDENNNWKIIGRSDDTLNVAGKRMGPAEIESILTDCPIVQEAAVIGAPDALKGEVPVCFVVLNEGYVSSQKLANELIEMVTNLLGKALCPKTIYFVTDLPKTRSAKIMRRVIKAAYLEGDLGDLSALENPESIEKIKSACLIKE